MCDKCKMQRNAKHLMYTYHGLFVNSPVAIIVKSCLKSRSILRLFKSLSRSMAHSSHVACACYQTMPQNLFALCSFAKCICCKVIYVLLLIVSDIYQTKDVFNIRFGGKR